MTTSRAGEGSEPHRPATYGRHEKPTAEGRLLFHLFGISLGAAISFLPATYLVLLPRSRQMGLSPITLSVVWVLIGLLLMWEFWKAAVLNWKHEMNFRPHFCLTLYLALSSAYVVLLVMLPAAVGYSTYLRENVTLTAYTTLKPLVLVLIAMQVVGMLATVLKFFETAQKERQRKLENATAIVVNIVILLVDALWIALAVKAPTDVIIWTLAALVLIEMLGLKCVNWVISLSSDSESPLSVPLPP